MIKSMELFSDISSNIKEELSCVSSLLNQTTITTHLSVFEISVNDIHQLSDIQVKNKIKVFFGLFRSPIIYYFELLGCNDSISINEWFCKAKESKHENRAYSKLNEVVTKNEITLYVGSSKSEYLKSRMYNHFGVGAKGVYSMHLKAWLPKDIDFVVRVHVFEPIIPEHNLSLINMLELIEQGFWNHYQPLFGKRSGLL